MSFDFVDLLTVGLSAAALVVAILSWRSTDRTRRASLYDRRFEVFADTEAFLSAWSRGGKPDISLLSRLVGAWTRSQFLFDNEVTDYLREVWKDAVKVNYLYETMDQSSGTERGDKVKEAMDLLQKNVDFDKLRAVFKKSMTDRP